jgi:hypothetical protein
MLPAKQLNSSEADVSMHSAKQHCFALLVAALLCCWWLLHSMEIYRGGEQTCKLCCCWDLTLSHSFCDELPTVVAKQTTFSLQGPPHSAPAAQL